MGNKDKLAQNYEGIFSQLTTLKTFHINARNKCPFTSTPGINAWDRIGNSTLQLISD
jgi:hypothetical protein